MNATGTSEDSASEGGSSVSAIFGLSVFISLVTSLVILVGNTLTVVCVWRTPELKTLTNMYIVSLAVADFLTGCFMPLNLAALIEVSKDLHFNKLFCLVLISENLVTVGVSVTSMVLIAVDRFLYIVRPLNYVSVMTINRTKMLITLSWVVSMSLNTIPIYHNKWDPTVGCSFFKTVSDDFVTFYLCLYYCAGSTVSGILYGIIFRVAWKQHKTVVAAHGKNAYSSLTKANCRRLKLFFVVFGIYFVCWFPVMLTYVVGKFVFVPHWLSYFTIPLVYVNSGANCFVYALMNRDFKQALKTLFSDVKRHVFSF